MSKSQKIKLVFLFILLLATFFVVFVAFREDRKGTLTVAFLNVGQGDAIYIEGPNGNQILVDGGPGKSVLRELSKMMPFYDRSIDVVIASHADQDHVGGLPDVLKKYKVGIFMEPGVPGESSSYEEFKGKIEKLKIKRLEARRGMEIDLGEGAVLQILFPDRDPSGMETNMASIVARLVYGENEFLLTGDSPQPIENYLVSLEGGKCQGSTLTCNSKLESDVLKAGHHGSKTSTGSSFVSAVLPQYAVISAGKDNRYGHPNQEVLDILTNFGATILRTDLSGRIIFKSDGVKLELK